MKTAKGAFGKPKKIKDPDMKAKKIYCFRCIRLSKFTKKNFPMPVVHDKKKIGYICRVCVRKAYRLKMKSSK